MKNANAEDYKYIGNVRNWKKFTLTKDPKYMRVINIMWRLAYMIIERTVKTRIHDYRTDT